MAHLIDKDHVVAEIERMMAEEMALFEESLKDDSHEISAAPVVYTRLQMLLSAINTLEVKEVDLEKEAELIANGIMIGVQANKYHTNVYNTKRNDFNHSHLMLAARKGIELGMQQSKNESNNE